MPRYLVPRFAAQVEVSTMTDDELQTLAGNIALAAQTSPLVAASAPMQASVAALAGKGIALTSANKTVADDHIKLRIDLAAEAVARSEMAGEVRTYLTLVTNAAKSPGDVEAAGLPPRAPRAPRNTPPTVPEQLIEKRPKKGRGQTIVSVYDTGKTQHEYVAQQSVDGINWTQLGVGHGKTRVVTGPSGTKVWVRFAMVRSQMQSDWSTALQITIP